MFSELAIGLEEIDIIGHVLEDDASLVILVVAMIKCNLDLIHLVVDITKMIGVVNACDLTMAITKHQ